MPSHMTSRSESQDPLSQRLRQGKRLLDLDESTGTAWVESGMTMDQLVRATLKRGFIPAVSPEFKGITVGGAIAGAGLESSSWQWGQFNDACTDYEVLLPGERSLQLSAEEHSDLFHALPGSYGTLGKVACARLKVLPAKPAVRLSYQHVSLDEVSDVLAGARADFIDGMILDADTAVIMTGDCVETSAPLIHFDRVWNPWFCQHVLTSQDGQEDSIPIYDYLFRYDRAAFWMGQFVTRPKLCLRFLLEQNIRSHHLARAIHQSLKEQPPTLNPGILFRTLMGWKLSSTQLYRVLHSIPRDVLASTFLVQDCYIPQAQLGNFLSEVCRELTIYPLWLCPIKGGGPKPFLSPHFSEEGADFVNVGIYGIPKHCEAIPDQSRVLEALTKQFGGRKMLYAIHTYTREEFWAIYDRPRYLALREKYQATELPDLYDTIR